MSGHVYMTSNKPRGVIYTGVTSDLGGRISEHKQQLTGGFTARYNAKLLVWYERHENIQSAIQREKSIKRYRRDWKINLIEALNPTWKDLSDDMYERDYVFTPTFQKRFDAPDV